MARSISSWMMKVISPTPTSKSLNYVALSASALVARLKKFRFSLIASVVSALKPIIWQAPKLWMQFTMSIHHALQRCCVSCSTVLSTAQTIPPTSMPWLAPTLSWAPTAPVAERNILGVIHKVGLEIGGQGHPDAEIWSHRCRNDRWAQSSPMHLHPRWFNQRDYRGTAPGD